MTSRGVEQPPTVTASTSAPLQTPLQSQICAVSGRSAGPASDASASAWSGSSIGSPGADGGDERLGAARVPEQDRADDAPVARGELAVDPGGAVGDDGLVVALGVAGADEVDAGDLELRARHRAEVGRRVAGERGGRDARLVVDRRDEPVDDPAMLRALSDGEDAGQVRAHRVVDEDPALAVDAHLAGERRLGADADGDDDEVGEQPLAALEVQAGRALGADDRRRVALELDLHVERGERGREQRAGTRVELALHEAVEQVDDGHGAALRGDAARCLEPEQAAADDGRVLRAAGGRGADRLAVLGPAEGVHAGQVDAGDRRHERLGAGREDELVVGQRAAVVEREAPGLGVDRGHPRPSSRSTSLSAYHSPGRSCSVSGSSPETRISDSRTRSYGALDSPQTSVIRTSGSRSRSASQTAWPAIPPPTITTESLMRRSSRTAVSRACCGCFQVMNGRRAPKASMPDAKRPLHF